MNNEIDSFENLSNQVKDILECRVESALNAMSVTSLCDQPSEPCSIEEFTKIADETREKATQSLSR